ncbi:MAG: type II toxin-antitoxin system mRNA interferase toxin, RelE/StbE family [Bacteriovoracaceae bacterium]|jgi:addiction module RelE/StbE family toxin|nr:type II toxin-antitoxin system mRNA interferase toxin, RelE/StbE family [Halobacteriovoraceae bacterium]MDP7320851.1 type II toxin-antitoxin system mRNA interferase toxin, RelE/StbE family [Bacteriovoracaceae bacterium]
MWDVFEQKSVSKALKKAPVEVLKRYEAWKRIVEISGPGGLKLIKGFRDESLKGEWKGYRSSRLGIKWRVIYKIHNEVFEIHVFEVTPHKY